MIKFFLHQEDETYFAVLEMDEKQRKYGSNRTMSNGVRISSYEGPAIDADTVFLRGSNLDIDKIIYVCSDLEIHAGKIIEALREWATTGGFFPEEAKSAQVSSSQSVFSF